MSIFTRLFGKKDDEETKTRRQAKGVRFREVETTNGNRYEVFTATSRDTALEFLRAEDVKEERSYLVVETPDGSFGKDLVMIFDEKTSEMIEFGERKPLPQLKKSKAHCARCGYAVLPAGRAVAGVTEMIVMEDLKKKGVGFSCQTCRTLWCPFCISLQGAAPICGICGKVIKLLRA